MTRFSRLGASWGFYVCLWPALAFVTTPARSAAPQVVDPEPISAVKGADSEGASVETLNEQLWRALDTDQLDDAYKICGRLLTVVPETSPRAPLRLEALILTVNALLVATDGAGDELGRSLGAKMTELMTTYLEAYVRAHGRGPESSSKAMEYMRKVEALSSQYREPKSKTDDDERTADEPAASLFVVPGAEPDNEASDASYEPSWPRAPKLIQKVSSSNLEEMRLDNGQGWRVQSHSIPVPQPLSRVEQLAWASIGSGGAALVGAGLLLFASVAQIARYEAGPQIKPRRDAYLKRMTALYALSGTSLAIATGFVATGAALLHRKRKRRHDSNLVGSLAGSRRGMAIVVGGKF